MIEPKVVTDTRNGDAAKVERAVRRVALFLDRPERRVTGNLPGALQDVLCRLPWDARLRRERDRVLIADARRLFELVEPDDLRRPRLKYLLEHAERRTRL
jgi:hypothetical protein